MHLVGSYYAYLKLVNMKWKYAIGRGRATIRGITCIFLEGLRKTVKVVSHD